MGYDTMTDATGRDVQWREAAKLDLFQMLQR